MKQFLTCEGLTIATKPGDIITFVAVCKCSNSAMTGCTVNWVDDKTVENKGICFPKEPQNLFILDAIQENTRASLQFVAKSCGKDKEQAQEISAQFHARFAHFPWQRVSCSDLPLASAAGKINHSNVRKWACHSTIQQLHDRRPILICLQASRSAVHPCG